MSSLPMENEIKIHTPYITLGQFLKLTNIISNGGEAKAFLMSEAILVNGEPENRRGRKLYPGDKVTYSKKVYLISNQ